MCKSGPAPHDPMLVRPEHVRRAQIQAETLGDQGLDQLAASALVVLPAGSLHDRLVIHIRQLHANDRGSDVDGDPRNGHAVPCGLAATDDDHVSSWDGQGPNLDPRPVSSKELSSVLVSRGPLPSGKANCPSQNATSEPKQNPTCDCRQGEPCGGRKPLAVEQDPEGFWQQGVYYCRD